MKTFGAVLVVIGYLCMMLATLSGVGYGLYLLGAVGLAFGPAAWGGFVLFLKMFGGGIVSLLVGFGLQLK
jgi:hypothetical protein